MSVQTVVFLGEVSIVSLAAAEPIRGRHNRGIPKPLTRTLPAVTTLPPLLHLPSFTCRLFSTVLFVSSITYRLSPAVLHLFVLPTLILLPYLPSHI